MRYESVIGLEVHIHLLTVSKIFCSCSAAFGAAPNSHVCPVCLGLPGVLPVLNRQVVAFALRLAIATDSQINRRSVFARKNYFYPDLPKGYQISQFEEPFCLNGHITIKDHMGIERRIGLTRIHLEEDAGKSMHAEAYVDRDETLVDVNRCGVPLLEIVSEPDIRTAREAGLYLAKLRQLVRYLGICDGNMEEGSLRCDANVSLRPVGSDRLGVKTELKNMNSFRNVERAIDFEIARQTSCLESGRKIEQETLLWDADRNVATAMRSKEYSHDYRYFPEPDLVAIEISATQIEQTEHELPELPDAKKERFLKEYGLPVYDVDVLTQDQDVADYYEAVASRIQDKKIVSNWIMGEVMRAMKENNQTIRELKVTSVHLAQIIQMINDGLINGKIAKEVFDKCCGTGEAPEAIVKTGGMAQITDMNALESAVEAVIKDNPNDVQAYLGGKEKILGFLVGQVMRATSGKANPQSVNDILREKLRALNERIQ
jgi:aspartyl-tRNA(Asn)/glutamyl-tRNA(Gln) amidotransferase subunit B